MTGAHHHGHEHDAPLKAITAAFSITFVFFIVELVGGWWTGSLALIADAMHMAIDLVALAMSLFAAFMAKRPPDAKRTFGYKRVEVLAALANGVVLWVATGVIVHEAWSRLVFPTPVAAPEMIGIAVLGLLANIASGTILFRSSRHNINLRGAFMHSAADAMGSLGAIIAGVIILKTRWYQADALASGAICAGIVFTSYYHF